MTKHTLLYYVLSSCFTNSLTSLLYHLIQHSLLQLYFNFPYDTLFGIFVASIPRISVSLHAILFRVIFFVKTPLYCFHVLPIHPKLYFIKYHVLFHQLCSCSPLTSFLRFNFQQYYALHTLFCSSYPEFFFFVF